MPVLRTMMNRQREFNPQAFQVFGPKIVATRGRYDDKALESRFITEEMGAKPLRTDIPINLPDSFKDEARELRNKLLLYRFHRRHEVKIDESLLVSVAMESEGGIGVPWSRRVMVVVAAPSRIVTLEAA